MKRRTFLKGAVAGGVVAVAAGAGLLKPTEVLASEYPAAAFGQEDLGVTLKALFGTADHTASDKITIDAPIQAENSAVVPVTAETSLAAESIAILVAKNPGALSASADLSNGASGYFRTRVKMAKTSDIIVVVKSGGKLYSAKKLTKVTVGGCGG